MNFFGACVAAATRGAIHFRFNETAEAGPEISEDVLGDFFPLLFLSFVRSSFSVPVRPLLFSAELPRSCAAHSSSPFHPSPLAWTPSRGDEADSPDPLAAGGLALPFALSFPLTCLGVTKTMKASRIFHRSL